MTCEKNTKRCVIVGGADINNYETVRFYLKDDDFCIYCDCGLRHLDAMGRSPDLIVGDFDSFEKPSPESRLGRIETIALPRAKDDTDTVFAAKEALSRGYRDFLILGAIGGRFDHSVGNAALLLLLHENDARAVLVDDYSEMSIVDYRPTPVDDSYSFFSLLSIFGKAEGVSISGAVFPLDNAVISPEYQYGISNEVIPGQTALISVKNGKLLLVKVR